jgi:hypothetical protein
LAVDEFDEEFEREIHFKGHLERELDFLVRDYTINLCKERIAKHKSTMNYCKMMLETTSIPFTKKKYIHGIRLEQTAIDFYTRRIEELGA